MVINIGHFVFSLQKALLVLFAQPGWFFKRNNIGMLYQYFVILGIPGLLFLLLPLFSYPFINFYSLSDSESGPEDESPESSDEIFALSSLSSLSYSLLSLFILSFWIDIRYFFCENLKFTY